MRAMPHLAPYIDANKELQKRIDLSFDGPEYASLREMLAKLEADATSAQAILNTAKLDTKSDWLRIEAARRQLSDVNRSISDLARQIGESLLMGALR